MHNKNKTLIEKFGLRVKFERIKLDISQEKLAELAGLHPNSIGAIERGKGSPTLDTIEALAKVFKMKACELLDVDNISLD